MAVQVTWHPAPHSPRVRNDASPATLAKAVAAREPFRVRHGPGHPDPVGAAQPCHRAALVARHLL
eukprot:11224116-Alexandrium_andersonii.AAC.1